LRETLNLTTNPDEEIKMYNESDLRAIRNIYPTRDSIEAIESLMQTTRLMPTKSYRLGTLAKTAEDEVAHVEFHSALRNVLGIHRFAVSYHTEERQDGTVHISRVSVGGV
jgi:hypothetical protein